MWYVMRTVPGSEEEAVRLMERVLDHKLWKQCRILKKERLFRIRGQYVVNQQAMFPGYILIETNRPKGLLEELEKARAFPKILGDGVKELVPLEADDLDFLQSVCGENLNKVMGLSNIEVDAEGQICGVQGILEPYAEQIQMQRLRKRFVVVKVYLFNREQKVLFGVKMSDDMILPGVE